MNEESSNIKTITAFFYALKLEKGLSENTILSYQSDLKQYQQYLKANHLSMFKIQEQGIVNYVKYLKLLKLSNKSISRKLSSVKQYYLFLLKSKLIDSNQFNAIRQPKTQSSIPKPLSEKKIEDLLSAPDIKTVLGFRDKTMFEFLRRTEKGQDLAEYALLIGLIALVVILAVTILGTNISEVFSSIASSVPSLCE